jgi:hypothetical protein
MSYTKNPETILVFKKIVFFIIIKLIVQYHRVVFHTTTAVLLYKIFNALKATQSSLPCSQEFAIRCYA